MEKDDVFELSIAIGVLAFLITGTVYIWTNGPLFLVV